MSTVTKSCAPFGSAALRYRLGGLWTLPRFPGYEGCKEVMKHVLAKDAPTAAV